MNTKIPLISRGKRAIVAGRTGNGKSTLACYLLQRSPGHWIVLNPKHTRAYSSLAGAKVLSTIDYKKIEQSLLVNRFTIINPSGVDASVESLDNLINELHESYTDIGLCADELYTLHNNGHAKPGLLGWLTRGRELGQSFLGLTQRPKWVSPFLFSESDYIGGMDLSLDTDRKRLYEMTGNRHFLERLESYRWLWYDVARDKIRKFGPVPK